MIPKNQFEKLEHIINLIHDRIPFEPEIALVLGSGLGKYADTLDQITKIPYFEIPGMPESKVVGHAGNFVFGYAHGIPVVAMQGRVHLYEGHSAEDVVFGTRFMIHLGAKKLIITNAAGGINEHLEVGDLMLITDQINMTAQNPLIGQNDERLGQRFVDMTQAYDKTLQKIAEKSASHLGILLKEGVYAGLLGPTYETPAEIKMLSEMRADAVGMSTVLEVIAARHMSAQVLGISCITNKAAGLGHETLSHDDVKIAAAKAEKSFISLVDDIIMNLRKN